MKLVLDTSAVIAMVLDEPEGADFRALLTTGAAEHLIGAPSMVETLMVLAGKGYEDAANGIDPVLREQAISIVPFDADHVRAAHDAFLRFGKGRHPAALNFGDCMAYALAKVLDAPLLFKGDDFRKTDIMPAL